MVKMWGETVITVFLSPEFWFDFQGDKDSDFFIFFYYYLRIDFLSINLKEIDTNIIYERFGQTET